MEHTITDPANTSSGVILCLKPPQSVADRIHVEGGVRASELHVTLAFLGKKQILHESNLNTLRESLEGYCKDIKPLRGSLNGVARFTMPPEQKDPIVLNVDVPGLSKIREDLVQLCSQAGIPVASDHGFTPHMTLTYVTAEDRNPIDRWTPVDVQFDSIELWVGGTRHIYPLLSSPLQQKFSEGLDQIMQYSQSKITKAHATGYPLRGRMEFQGLQISIEQQVGDTRCGTDPDGHEWSVTMKHPYGYIRMTEGSDGDHVDCYIGPNPHAREAYIITQNSPVTHEYDEQKVMLGFDSQSEAVEAYMQQYDNPAFFGGVTAMDMDTFRGKVLHRENWGKVIKAEQQSKMQDARMLMAHLTGDLIKARHTDRQINQRLQVLQQHHSRSADGMGAAIRNIRGSALEDAFLDHAEEAATARRVLDQRLQ